MTNTGCMNEEKLLLTLLDKKNRQPQLKAENNLTDEMPSYRRLGLPAYEDQYLYVAPQEASLLYHRCGKLMVTWRSFLVVLVEVHKDPGYEDIRVSFFPPSIVSKDECQNEIATNMDQSEESDDFYNIDNAKPNSGSAISQKIQARWTISKPDGQLVLEVSNGESEIIIDRETATLILSALPEISRLAIPRNKRTGICFNV